MPKVKSDTWIFLRGLAREHGHWGPFVDRFSERFPEDQILLIDLPGSGDHVHKTSPRSISACFDFVRGEAITKARTQSQFKILSLSMGGMVAMEWMRRRPEDLAACVLINSSVRRLSPAFERLRWQVWTELPRLMALQSARERERAIIGLVMNNAEAREAALPLWTKIALERPMSYVNFFNQLWAAGRFEGLTQPPTVPVLLLNGLGDRLVDPSCSTQMHEHLAWPLVRHPWAGHDLPWDDPKWVVDQVQNWSVGTLGHKVNQ